MIVKIPTWLSRIGKVEIVNTQKPIPVLPNSISQRYPRAEAISREAALALNPRK